MSMTHKLSHNKYDSTEKSIKKGKKCLLGYIII